MSVPEFVRESIVICGTYTMSLEKSLCLLSHLLVSFLLLYCICVSKDKRLAMEPQLVMMH